MSITLSVGLSVVMYTKDNPEHSKEIRIWSKLPL